MADKSITITDPVLRDLFVQVSYDDAGVPQITVTRASDPPSVLIVPADLTVSERQAGQEFAAGLRRVYRAKKGH